MVGFVVCLLWVSYLFACMYVCICHACAHNRCKGTIFFLHTQQNSAEIAFFCHFPQSFDIVVYHQIVKLRLKNRVLYAS